MLVDFRLGDARELQAPHPNTGFDTSPCHPCSGYFCLACQLRKSTTCDDVNGLSNGNGNFFPCHFDEFDAPREFCRGNMNINTKWVPFGTRPPGHSAAQNLAKLFEDAKSVKLAAKGNVPATLPAHTHTCESEGQPEKIKEGHLRA